MTPRVLIILSLLGLVGPVLAQELVVTVEKPELKMLEAARITAVLRNTSQENIYIGRRGRYLDYDIYVKDGLHNLVQDSHYKRWMKAQAIDDNYDRVMKPGGSEKWTVPINLLYDMTRPGIYFIETYKNVRIDSQGKSQVKRLKGNDVKVIVTSEYEDAFAETNSVSVTAQ